MRTRRSLSLLLAVWAVSSSASARAEFAGGAAPAADQAGPAVPVQVAYGFAISTRGISVETAASPYDALFGTVTLACLDRGGTAIVGRDAKNIVVYQAVLHAPPKDDLAVNPYSRAFSEIRRIAWNVCTPAQQTPRGEQRTVEQKGSFALGGFSFPDEIKIKDQLGSVGCEASASDKTGRAMPCTSRTPAQPFISTLTRKASR